MACRGPHWPTWLNVPEDAVKESQVPDRAVARPRSQQPARLRLPEESRSELIRPALSIGRAVPSVCRKSLSRSSSVRSDRIAWSTCLRHVRISSALASSSALGSCLASVVTSQNSALSLSPVVGVSLAVRDCKQGDLRFKNFKHDSIGKSDETATSNLHGLRCFQLWKSVWIFLDFVQRRN